MLSNRRAFAVMMAVTLSLGLLAPASAWAAPDATNFQVVTQPDGAFVAYKNAEFYLDGNPMDPFPGNGFNTFVYTIQNDCASPLPLVGFSVGIPGPAAVSNLPASFGPGTAPDGPGVIGGAEVEWDFFNTPIQPCDTSQALYIETTYTPGMAAHTIISVDGELSFDASTLCIGPETPPAECDLEIDKTCCVPASPMPGGDICEGKVTQMVLEYTGDTCSASNNSQSGKATCSGSTGGSQPVSITITQDPTKVGASPNSGINVGDNVTLNALQSEFGSQTSFKVIGSGGTQTLSIHTSCSQALRCGDHFGGMRLVSLTTTNGGTDVCPDPNAGPGSQCVAQSGTAGTACTSRPMEVVFEYTGSNCQVPLPNPQGGKATCSGSPNGAQPVSVTYTGKDPSKITVSPASGINVGETFHLTATGRDELHADSTLVITGPSGVVQNLKIHTSCSQSLKLGDEFGSLKVVGMTTPTQGTIALQPPNATPFLQACEVPIAPPTPHCTDSVQELHLAYIDNLFGLGCSVSNTQGGNASCTGVAAPGQPASITIVKDPTKVSATPNSGLNVPDVTVLTHIDGKLAKDTEFRVSGPGGSQTLKIRTSCSKPLNIGDRFGSMAVVGIDRGDGDADTDDGDDGFVGLGSPVEFQYKVTNPNASPATNVTVVDDLFGTIGTGITVPPNGGMVTLFETKTLYSTLTNTATVTGEVNGSQCDEAQDSVTTTVELPPQGNFVCSNAKPLNTITFVWDGTQNVRIKAWKGTVGSTLLADIPNIAVGQVISVSGYAGAPNDVTWEIFQANTSTKIGESTFHLSCSDSEMNGVEDCGKREGNNKANSPTLINDWLLEGLAGNGKTLDCTPDPIVLPGPGFCGLGFELAFLLPPLMWLRRRKGTLH